MAATLAGWATRASLACCSQIARPGNSFGSAPEQALHHHCGQGFGGPLNSQQGYMVKKTQEIGLGVPHTRLYPCGKEADSVRFFLLPLAATMRWTTFAIALVFAVSLGAARAEAQRLPSVLTTGDEQAAKEFYQDGAELVETGHAAAGVEKLLKAYELSGAALPLFALAHAYSLMLDHEQTSDVARVILEDHASLAPDLRTRTRQLLTEAQKHVGVVRLMGVPDDAVEVTLDGQAVDDARRRPLFYSFLPGLHEVHLRDGFGQEFHWKGEVAAGQTREVLVRFEQDAESTLLDEPWFWIASGAAAVLLVGAAIAIGASGDEGPSCEGKCLPL